MKRLDPAVKEFLATTRKSPASAPRDELHASVEREYENFSQRTSVLLELPANGDPASGPEIRRAAAPEDIALSRL